MKKIFYFIAKAQSYFSPISQLRAQGARDGIAFQEYYRLGSERDLLFPSFFPSQ
jgi:hypothetical protein